MRIQFFRPPFHPLKKAVATMLLFVMLGLMACAGKQPAQEPAATTAARAVFQLGGVSYYKPDAFEVSESFTLTGGMAAYTAAADSRLLKIAVTPVVAQSAIPYELTQLKCFGEDGAPAVGSYSIESFSGSKDAQTDMQIISRSTLQKDGVSMLYLSHILYIPIDRTSRSLTMKYGDTALFVLDLEKSAVK